MLGKMQCYGATDVGRRRESNEDQFLIADLKKSMDIHQTSLALDHHTRLYGGSQGKLLMVADGMGGHAAGERASTLAVDGVATYVLNTMHWMFRVGDDDEDDFIEDLKASLLHCQKVLAAEAEAIPSRRGMGATLTMAYIVWPRMFVVHAGDSRCYLFRGRRLAQITQDHTMAQKFIDEGSLSPEEAKASRWSHVLWNVLGGSDGAELFPEAHRVDLELGDTVLLCTDGLTNHLDSSELAQHLASPGSCRQTCHRLIDAANAKGGSDNITAVLARFQKSTDEPDEEEAEAELPTQRGEADTDPHIVAATGA